MYSSSKYYRLWDINSNSLVAEGSADDCSKQLGMNRRAFYSFVFRAMNNRKSQYKVDIETLSPRPVGRKWKKYTVIERNTLKIVAEGLSSDCAEALGITVRTFYDLVARVNKGKTDKYIIKSEIQ